MLLYVQHHQLVADTAPSNHHEWACEQHVLINNYTITMFCREDVRHILQRIYREWWTGCDITQSQWPTGCEPAEH
jgi:hypothetical protein